MDLLHINNIDHSAVEKLRNEHKGTLSQHIFHRLKLHLEVRGTVYIADTVGYLLSTVVIWQSRSLD